MSTGDFVLEDDNVVLLNKLTPRKNGVRVEHVSERRRVVNGLSLPVLGKALHAGSVKVHVAIFHNACLHLGYVVDRSKHR